MAEGAGTPVKDAHKQGEVHRPDEDLAGAQSATLVEATGLLEAEAEDVAPQARTGLLPAVEKALVDHLVAGAVVDVVVAAEVAGVGREAVAAVEGGGALDVGERSKWLWLRRRCPTSRHHASWTT